MQINNNITTEKNIYLTLFIFVFYLLSARRPNTFAAIRCEHLQLENDIFTGTGVINNIVTKIERESGVLDDSVG